MGLVAVGYVKPSQPGDLEEHQRWLKNNHYFGLWPESETT